MRYWQTIRTRDETNRRNAVKDLTIQQREARRRYIELLDAKDPCEARRLRAKVDVIETRVHHIREVQMKRAMARQAAMARMGYGRPGSAPLNSPPRSQSPKTPKKKKHRHVPINLRPPSAWLPQAQAMTQAVEAGVAAAC